MLKAIIFDMDGVIINSEPQHERAALRVFARHGVHVGAEYHDQYVGSSTRKMAEETIENFGLSVTAETLLEELNIEKKTVLQEEGYQPLPGIIGMIEKLHSAGIRLAIASSSSPSEIEDCAKALGIQKYFDKLVSSAHVKKPKPAPDIFTLALKELGVIPKEAIVIEDSGNGCLAAKAAGIACAGYINPHSGEQDLSSAAILLESFENLDAPFFTRLLQRSLGEPVTIANTKRLTIRELTRKDIPSVYAMYKDPAIQKSISNLDSCLETEMDKQAAYIQNAYAFYNYGIWGVYCNGSGDLIGKCGIENQIIDGTEEIMLSYLIDRKHWGKGYASESCKAVLSLAKKELHIQRVVAAVQKENERSAKTAASLGMVPEKEITYQGHPCLLYAIQL